MSESDKIKENGKKPFGVLSRTDRVMSENICFLSMLEMRCISNKTRGVFLSILRNPYSSSQLKSRDCELWISDISKSSTKNIEDGSMLILKPSSASTKKAQAAMEFLMTYGWAILVVLVAISALAYFGVLDMKFLTRNSCTLPVGLSCLDHRVYTYDLFGTKYNGLEINLKNNLGQEIQVTAFDTEVFNNKHQILDVKLANGEKTSSPNNIVVMDLTNIGNGGEKMNSGDKYSIEFKLTHTNTATGLTHVEKGTVSGKVE